MKPTSSKMKIAYSYKLRQPLKGNSCNNNKTLYMNEKFKSNESLRPLQEEQCCVGVCMYVCALFFLSKRLKFGNHNWDYA